MTRPFALLAALGLVLGACAATTDHDRPVARTAAASPAHLITPSPAKASPVALPPPATPGPSAIADAVAWARIRTAMPAGVSVGAPIWLPPSIDRARVDLEGIVSGPDDPRFVLTYYGTKGAIAYALGPIDEVGGTGYGTSVRGARATLTFATSLFTDPNTPAPRRVRWQEGTRTFSISSDTYSGDDLLHIAYQLERAAPDPGVSAPIALGACARPGGTAEETVAALVSLAGRHRPDAVNDCYGYGYPYRDSSAGWSGLPTATLESTKLGDGPGGRTIVFAIWTFASDPGGAWNLRPSMFFALSQESGGVWRIQEVGTAANGPPP